VTRRESQKQTCNYLNYVMLIIMIVKNLLTYHACPLLCYHFNFFIMCAPITISMHESLCSSLSFFVSSIFLWEEPLSRRCHV
jgi:hypothetical protein